MAMGPDKAFETLYGRQPTDAERLRLMKVKDALKLPDDDAVWAIFLALGHYQTLYEAMPKRIEETTERLCASISTTAETATIARLSERIARQVDAISGRVAWRRLAYAAIAAVAVFGASLYGVYHVVQSRAETYIAVETAKVQLALETERDWKIAAIKSQSDRLLRLLHAAANLKPSDVLTSEQIQAIGSAVEHPAVVVWAGRNAEFITKMQNTQKSHPDATVSALWGASPDGRLAKAFFDGNERNGGVRGFNTCEPGNIRTMKSGAQYCEKIFWYKFSVP